MITARQAIPKYILQVSFVIVLLSACLFFSSGRANWFMGWVFIAILAGSQFSAAFILMISNPGLLANRAEIRGKRDLDRIFAGILAFFGPAAICIVAGLNKRFGWSPEIPFPVQIAGIIVAIFGSVLTVWAMASNKFFYGVLRIANEKGHTVSASGPYYFIRHPGYLGAILFDLATPLMLNSMWALISAIITTCIIVLRTSTEDKALGNGLNGHKEYVESVRYQLLPWVW